jgi:hypothetical protein
LLAADELCITEIVGFLQDVLVTTHRDWLDLNFEYVYRTVYDNELFDKLHEYCNEMFCINPRFIFTQADFVKVPEQVLVDLICRNELRLEEVEIWDHIIRWGVQQNPPLHPDVSQWRHTDFEELKVRLHNLIPHIRFCQIPMQDYFNKIRPYERILPDEIYQDILRYYFRNPIETMTILPPRQGRMNSDIINSTEAALISSWVDWRDRASSGWSPYGPTENPYAFEPVFRGTGDDFLAGEFHRRLNDLDATLMVFEMRDGRVIGGYHLIHPDGRWNDRDGFLFVLGQNNISESVINRVHDVRQAIMAGSSSDGASANDIDDKSGGGDGSGAYGLDGAAGHYDDGYEDSRLSAVNAFATLIRYPTQNSTVSCYDSEDSDCISLDEEREVESTRTEVVKFEMFHLLKRRQAKRLSNVAFNVN